jgi:hypothetical protein
MRDIDVRLAVRKSLDDAHAGDSETRIVEEMGIWAGSVRVDIAVINGELHGVELKSARDTLERLPNQITLYSEVFDRMTLVVAERHVEKAIASIPGWWGVVVATNDSQECVRLHPVRSGSENLGLSPLQIARLLWRSEALSILQRTFRDKGVRSKSSDVVARRLAESLPVDILRAEVRVALRARFNWLRQPVANEFQMSI